MLNYFLIIMVTLLYVKYANAGWFSSVYTCDYSSAYGKFCHDDKFKEQTSKGKGYSSLIKNQKGEALGSATRICLDFKVYDDFLSQFYKLNANLSSLIRNTDGSEWFITALHVVGDKNQIIIDDQKAEIVMRDEKLDLALIQMKKNDNRSKRKCAYLSINDSYVNITDVHQEGMESEHLAFEIPDKKIKKMTFHQTLGNVGIIKNNGPNMALSLSGRDMNKILEIKLNHPGLLGSSGAPVFAVNGFDTNIGLEKEMVDWYKKDHHIDVGPLMIGMMLAVDANSDRIYALPSKTIFMRILSHFGNPEKSKQELEKSLNRIKVPGGIYFKDYDVSICRGSDSGTGKGDDSGTGKGDDSGTGKGDDSGTGRGSTITGMSCSHHGSGILDRSEKLWLSIQDNNGKKYSHWAEDENPSENILKLFKTPEGPKGIFLKDGKLKLTAGSDLPYWFLAPCHDAEDNMCLLDSEGANSPNFCDKDYYEPYKDDFKDSLPIDFNFTFSPEKVADHLRLPRTACVEGFANVRKKEKDHYENLKFDKKYNMTIPYAGYITICESLVDNNTRKLRLYVKDIAASAQGKIDHAIELSMSKNNNDGQEINLSAKIYDVPVTKGGVYINRGNLFKDITFDEKKGSDLKNDGLGYFHNDQSTLSISKMPPVIRITVRHDKEEFLIVAPAR